MRLLLAVLTVALAAVAFCQQGGGSIPPSPHQPMNAEGGCVTCHSMYAGQVNPHGFLFPIIEICMNESCHTTAKIGRSHPVGIDVTKSRMIEGVPETFPLEDDTISCGSCHNPHGDWLTGTPYYPRQEPKVYLLESVGGETREVPYYTTYFLRIPGDPEEGFTVLCNSCHPR